jgi:branched-chain amino acid transport system permease protein
MLLAEQMLNGLQFGFMLFLMAAGLTLVFGVMNIINLAHGSLYMVGAFVAASTFASTGSFLLAIVAALVASVATGMLIETTVFRALYRRDHVDQVLATFGLILIFNDAVRILWGNNGLYSGVPQFLSGSVQVLPGLQYPLFRLAIIAVGIVVALLLFLLISKTRTGMLLRAGAVNRTMVGALGVNISLLYTVVFGLGAALAGLSGLMAGPVFTVSSGMGDSVTILALVVIVLGGIGSVRGALIAALLVGLVDTLGRAFLRPLLALVVNTAAAANAGPALASMLIYIMMACILLVRPQGLFPVRSR